MGDRLGQEKINEMWQAFQVKANYTYVSRKCAVSHVTVRRVAEREKWRERLLRIKEERALQEIEPVAEIKARWHKIIKATIGKYVEDLKSGNIKVTPFVLKSLLEAEMYLIGEPTSRIEIKVIVEKWTERVIRIINENVTDKPARERISRELAIISGEANLFRDSEGDSIFSRN